MRNVIKEKNLLLTKERIGNVDETSVFMEMYERKTLNIIGEKDRSFNKSYIRISLLLTILAY